MIKCLTADAGHSSSAADYLSHQWSPRLHQQLIHQMLLVATPGSASAAGGVQDENPDADDMTEMKAKACNMVIRMLRPGSLQRLLGAFVA